jgi:CYTH domain-containing protein
VDVSEETATALGFPKAHYRIIERERRWLCSAIPEALVLRTERITDLYVTATRLRLREARPLDGSTAMLRLTRKADADARTRLISSVYLSEDDFAVLSKSLNGARLVKLRHRLKAPDGVAMCVDEFENELTGLLIIEAECQSESELAHFPTPSFASREITDDPKFTGFALATRGKPGG